jgi:pyruvate/2-oxoglutarate/acetoin dehydrogenase E1 component
MRAISFGSAIREAMDQEMERDERVFVYGIGVPNHAKIFGTTDGLVEKYGPTRCFDTPIAEECMTGFGLGAAVKGLRPIHVHIRPDFLLVGMNQLVNMVSNYCYTTDGKVGVPMVIRAIIGRGWGQGYQHSKSLFSYFTHIPGLKVVAPTTPADAKGLLISAIRDDNPVIFLEHRWLYWATEAVPEEPYAIEFGIGRTLRAGTDLTVIGISWMNVEALRAADILQRHGVNIEVIDPRTLVPLDEDLLVTSVEKTGYCIVADCDWLESGVSAEIAARVSYRCFGKLKAPVERIGFAPTPCPTVRELEDNFYPHAGTIVRAVEAMLNLDAIDLSAEDFYSHEHRFKGPF